MHSKRLNSVIRVIITITALSNLFFCAAGVYYISTCNSIVTREVNSAGSGFGAPTWKGLDIHEAASFPKLKWNSSYGMTLRHNKSMCPEIPPNLGMYDLCLFNMSLHTNLQWFHIVSSAAVCSGKRVKLSFIQAPLV